MCGMESQVFKLIWLAGKMRIFVIEIGKTKSASQWDLQIYLEGMKDLMNFVCQAVEPLAMRGLFPLPSYRTFLPPFLSSLKLGLSSNLATEGKQSHWPPFFLYPKCAF